MPLRKRRKKVKALADFHFSVRSHGEESQNEAQWDRLFVLEAKKPGSLWPNEWDPTLTHGSRLGKNATLMSQQGRKYLTRFGVTDIIYTDGVRIAGIQLKNEDVLQTRWTGNVIRGAKVFCKEISDYFFPTFLSVLLSHLFRLGYA